jgi:hypothetical protein
LHSGCIQCPGDAGCPAGGTCDTLGDTQTGNCNTPTDCPVDRDCQETSVDGPCQCTASVTDAPNLGTTTRTWSRTPGQGALHGGAQCPHTDGQVETGVSCNSATGCEEPTDCQGEWRDNPCECTADRTDAPTAGTRTETYHVTTPSNQGAACPHDHLEQRPKAPPTCDTVTACRFDCVGAWSCWSDCSVGCSTGTQSRTFIVDAAAENGGLQCREADGSVEQRPCNTHACDECGADLQLCMLAPEARPVPSDNMASLCCCWAPAVAAALAILPLLLAILWLCCNRPVDTEDLAALGAPEDKEEQEEAAEAEAYTMWILMLLDPTGTRQ